MSIAFPHIRFGTMPLRLHPVVADWRNRCILNGSANGPSDSTLLAAHYFYENLVTSSLDTKFKSLNIMAPDDLTCAITPLINSASAFNNPWANTNFVSGDITINGLKSDGTKWLNSGVNPRTTFTTESNGITIMSVTPITENTRDAGVASATGTSDYVLYTDFSNFFIYDYGNVGGGDRISYNHAGTKNTGYCSGNVTAKNAQVIYYASGSVAHSAIVTRAVNVAGSLPPSQSYVFTANDGAATPGYRSSRRFSFVAFHTGLSTTDSFNLFGAIQRLRYDIGGGYV